MSTEDSKHAEPAAARLATLALFGLLVLFQLGSAFRGTPIFRPLHLGTALEYGAGPIDLLRPVIVGFTAGGTPAAQELPLWQATVGMVFHLTGSTWYGWGNIVSILFLAAGLWPLYQLARHYGGERVAWWTLALFLAQPLVVFFGGMGSTDGLCMVLSTWFLFCADRFIRGGGWAWWLAAALFAIPGTLSKAPFFMTVGVCAALLLLANRIRSPGRWLALVAIAALSGVALAFWTGHTDALAAQAEFPYFELRLSRSSEAVHWFFGNLGERLSPALWLKSGWRFAHATLGVLPAAALLVVALLKRGNWAPKLWLASALISTLVFTHVVFVHWHYYLMFAPAVAWLLAGLLAPLEERWARLLPQPALRGAILAGVLALATVDGLITMKISILMDRYPAQMAGLIREHTRPEDKIILYGGDWGGEELFRAGRRGLGVYAENSMPSMPTVTGLRPLLTKPENLRRLKELGYTVLVRMNESPVRFAAVAINPGSQRRRSTCPADISPEVEAWPVLYRSEDVLIQRLP